MVGEELTISLPVFKGSFKARDVQSSLHSANVAFSLPGVYVCVCVCVCVCVPILSTFYSDIFMPNKFYMLYFRQTFHKDVPNIIKEEWENI